MPTATIIKNDQRGSTVVKGSVSAVEVPPRFTRSVWVVERSIKLGGNNRSEEGQI